MSLRFAFFFFNDTATTEIYTLSLHDALPICRPRAEPAGGPRGRGRARRPGPAAARSGRPPAPAAPPARAPPRRPARRAHRGRSEEHTSELQSRSDLVCRLLLEKKKKYRQPPD